MAQPSALQPARGRALTSCPHYVRITSESGHPGEIAPSMALGKDSSAVLKSALFPGEFDREEWTASGAAFALAMAIAFVSELQTAALRIFFKAAG